MIEITPLGIYFTHYVYIVYTNIVIAKIDRIGGSLKN